MRPTSCAPQVADTIESSASPISCSARASSFVASPSVLGACNTTHTHSSQGRFSMGTSARIPRSTKMEEIASLTRAK